MSLLLDGFRGVVAWDELTSIRAPCNSFPAWVLGSCSCLILGFSSSLASTIATSRTFSAAATESPRFNPRVRARRMAEIWGNGGQAGQFPLEQWFYEMPICTRWWTTATVVTSLLVQCHVLTPFQLFYSFRAVFLKSQVTNSLNPLLESVFTD
jgi:hypothetical protein